MDALARVQIRRRDDRTRSVLGTPRRRAQWRTVVMPIITVAGKLNEASFQRCKKAAEVRRSPLAVRRRPRASRVRRL
jgi:hypothetical protein|tara:strand:+ start:380 stop:610 length:231 start_codon:yes stop_codon:yes gene_type:complete